jgi:hypothetical protein
MPADLQFRRGEVESFNPPGLRRAGLAPGFSRSTGEESVLRAFASAQALGLPQSQPFGLKILATGRVLGSLAAVRANATIKNALHCGGVIHAAPLRKTAALVYPVESFYCAANSLRRNVHERATPSLLPVTAHKQATF